MSASECARVRDKEKRVAERKSSLKYRQLYSFIYLYKKKFFFFFTLALLPSLRLLIWTHFMVHISFSSSSQIAARIEFNIDFFFSFAPFHDTHRFNDLLHKKKILFFSRRRHWRWWCKEQIKFNSPRKNDLHTILFV